MLGNPQNNLKIIYVTGTNGKGSTCSMLSSILQSAGYKVGLYTSPQLIHPKERIKINGEQISEENYEAISQGFSKKLKENNILISPYAFDVSVGFKYFENNVCDIVVLEALVGGMKDKANIMDKTAKVSAGSPGELVRIAGATELIL